ncbi:MAG TPA: RNA degradosome polyphosphate kinase, partial [Gallionella sp.]|nr:RNA degradosome polyphosphate kinase [Gallionella sp.]
MPKKFVSQQFLNRELGQLEFNRRVLAQAEDTTIPLLERLKYLCIVSSNLDEFFEIRVAGLMEQIKLGGTAVSTDGLNARQTLKLVREQAHLLIERQYQLFNTDITPSLAKQGIKFLRRTQWNEAQRAWVRDFFFREV